MGLDAVELVMEIEDHFGISLQDSEVAQIHTVGDLVTLLKSRIDAAHSAACPTLSSFLLLRTCAREITSNAHLRVRTHTRIQDSLLPFQRRELWQRLEVMLGSHPPSLLRSPILRKSLAAVGLASVIVALGAACAIDWAILPLTLGFALFFLSCVHYATVRFRVNPPVEMATFGAVAKRIAGTHVALSKLELRSFDAILDEVRPIVASVLGVDRSLVVAEARLIQDLGMG